MKPRDMVEHLKEHGYKEVQTFGGWVALDEWTPYGHPIDESPVNFIWYGDDRLRETVNSQASFLTGVWTIR